MDMHGFHRDVDEVRINIGPKFDMLVKLDGDHEEMNFTEELVEHAARGTPIGRPRTQCESRGGFRRRIVDSFSTAEVAMIPFPKGRPRG